MSTPSINATLRRLRRSAPLFAALGDEMRLSLLARLGDGSLHSITQLAEGWPISRQAITKHLGVLERAGLVRAARQGRETLFQLRPQSIAQASDSLRQVSEQWDAALRRLKEFVEE